MTVIVGLVHEGQVYIGGDSATTSGNNVFTKPEGKVFRTDAGILVGLAGDVRAINLFRYGFSPPSLVEGQDLNTYMRFTFVGALRDLLFDHMHIPTKDGYENPDLTGILGWRGQLWELSTNFTVTQRADPYVAVGSGDELALAALHVLDGLPPIERLDRALRVAERYDAGVRAPFTILTDEVGSD